MSRRPPHRLGLDPFGIKQATFCATDENGIKRTGFQPGLFRDLQAVKPRLRVLKQQLQNNKRLLRWFSSVSHATTLHR